MANFIKPEQTAPIEFREECGVDGEPVRVVLEHFRQGEHYYRITWRGEEPPLVDDEAAPSPDLSSAAGKSSPSTPAE